MTRTVCLGIGLLLAPCGIAGAQAPAKPPLASVNPRLPKDAQAAQLALKAEELLNANRPADAAAVFRQAAELTPEDWVLWDQAGWAFLDAGQPEAAFSAFEGARKAAPTGASGLNGMLVSQFLLGRRDEVVRLLKEAAPADPERAEQIVLKGLAAGAGQVDRHFALAYLLTRIARNSRRALLPAEAVARTDPKHADAWLLLVEINRDLDRGAQEDAAALKYLELMPETPDAYRLRAERYADLRRIQEAVAEYEAGIAKHPAAEELYYQLARVHERAGGIQNAEAVYRKLIAAAQAGKQEGLEARARAHLASFQTRRGRYVEAEAHYREAARKPDASAATWSTWGSLLALTGKWAEAAQALEGAADRDAKARGTTSPSVRDDLLTTRFRAAVCRLLAGQKEAARAGLEAALALRTGTRTSPEAEAAAFLLWTEGMGAKTDPVAYRRGDERWAVFTWRRPTMEGEFEARGRFSPGAVAWRAILQEVQKKHPDCWPADYALARVYAVAGFTDEALALLRKVVRARSDWWAPYFALGQYHAINRQKDEGVPVLRKAVELAPECRHARTYLNLLSRIRDEED